MLLPLLALAASATPIPEPINPGLPPPWPAGGAFDIPSVCFVIMTAEAERRHSTDEGSRYEDAASGFFAAEVSRAHPHDAQEVIAEAVKKVAGHPEIYRTSCADAFAVGYAPLGTKPPSDRR